MQTTRYLRARHSLPVESPDILHNGHRYRHVPFLPERRPAATGRIKTDWQLGNIQAAAPMPLTSPGNDDDTGENHQPTLRKNTAEPVEQTLKQNTDAVYTRGLGAGFAASTFSERTGGFSRQRWFDYGRLARLCDSYLRSGSVDLGKWRRSRLAEPVVPGLAVVMERWEAYLAGSGLASATVGHYRRMAGLFLTWLESHGVVSLDGSDGSHVLGFLAGLRSRWSESSMRHAASDLRPLFRWLGRDDLADAIGLAGIRRTHAIAGTLPDDEHRRLLEACASRSVPSRDAAITLLSLTCGLRACDVIGLRIADVDWDSMSIGLVQRKTGNPLTVPMTGPLAARLASWLLDERPATDDDRVFVRYKAPHVALRGHSSVYEAISRVMRHAGLGRRGGSRLLRRNAATRMLEAATPLPTISAVLGHADPDSTRVYMATHRGGMLACVLPVPEGGSS
jgi:integrase